MKEWKNIDLALKIATSAHYGQVDKQGKPYISHPITVMMDPLLTTENEQVVAVLHDTVEDDRNTTVGDIRRAFGDVIADAIDAITHRPHEEYVSYLERVMANELAFAVKKADVRHNSSESRIDNLDEANKKRLSRKYAKAKQILGMET